jgi:hypothetical protein
MKVLTGWPSLKNEVLHDFVTFRLNRWANGIVMANGDRILQLHFSSVGG